MVGHNNGAMGYQNLPQDRVGYTMPQPTSTPMVRPQPQMVDAQQPQQFVQNQNPAITHVQGEMEARVWPVAQGYTAILLDADESHVFIKGPNGFVKYTKDDNLEEYPYQQVDLTGYVKVEDVQQMISQAISDFATTLDTAQNKSPNVEPQRQNRSYNKTNYSKNSKNNRGGNKYDR